MNDLLVNKEAIRLKYLNEFGLEAPNILDYVDKDWKLIIIYVRWLETLVSEKLTEERKPVMSMHDFWEVNYHNIKRPSDEIEKCFGYEKSNNPGVQKT